jgi:hypothetical protein
MGKHFNKVSFINAVCNIGLWAGIGSLVITIISLTVLRLFPENKSIEFFFAEICPWIFGGGFIMLTIGRVAYWHLPSELQD